MARTFSSGNIITNASAVRSSVPITMACWFRQTSATTAVAMAITGTTNANRFDLDVTNTGVVRAISNGAGAGSAFADSTAGATLNAWSHGCAVFAGVADRRAYLNGANKGTNTTSRTPVTLAATRIGSFLTASDFPFPGDMAEAAMWSVALSDAEVAVLATGIAPYEVQRSSLVAYWPLIGLTSPEPDVVGSFPMTLTGTPAQAAHPFMFYGKSRLQRRGLLAA